MLEWHKNEQDVDPALRGSRWFPQDALLVYHNIQESARSYTDHKSITSFQGSNTEMANKAQACPGQYWLKQQMTFSSSREWIILLSRVKETPSFSPSLSLKWYLDFLKIHKVYIKVPWVLCLTERDKRWEMSSWGTQRFLRGQLSFTCSSITDHMVCHFSLIIYNNFWTTLAANISMLSYRPLRTWKPQGSWGS